ncbi:hypothetical protein SK803_24920 [Lentzea sp. BCCO 10_0856]|uniref:Uncharacterized protein n=1 Tax=Lentzea miocenica TaxID=3095431 RepID=A0ABU4T5W4_9PSEU|nr:hypothetical protein [Lentzea sp. BCCO 10_0856]
MIIDGLATFTQNSFLEKTVLVAWTTGTSSSIRQLLGPSCCWMRL